VDRRPGAVSWPNVSFRDVLIHRCRILHILLTTSIPRHRRFCPTRFPPQTSVGVLSRVTLVLKCRPILRAWASGVLRPSATIGCRGAFLRWLPRPTGVKHGAECAKITLLAARPPSNPVGPSSANPAASANRL